MKFLSLVGLKKLIRLIYKDLALMTSVEDLRETEIENIIQKEREK